FIVHNRMLSGGMVLDGRMVTLADVTCPVLAFVGSRDTFARPDAVRAIERAAPGADVRFAPLEAGHFGLGVGSRAMTAAWPSVVGWLRYRAGHGDPPAITRREADDGPNGAPTDDEPEEAAFDVEIDFAASAVSNAIERALDRVEEVVRDAGDSLAA